MHFLRVLLFAIMPFAMFGQPPVPSNGVPENRSHAYALKNVAIIVSPEKTIEKGTLLVKDGRIEGAGALVSVPKGYVEIDLAGKIIVPAFIELYSQLGIPAVREKQWEVMPQLETAKQGPYYWNEAIHPETDAAGLYTIDGQPIDELHKMGFGAAVVHQQDGIARGTGTLVTLGKESPGTEMLRSEIAAYYSFRKGVSQQTYPSSQVGSIALLRQAFYDAQWQKEYGESPNYSLDALNEQEKLPSVFETTDKYEIFRVSNIAREFGRQFTILGSGHEYELVAAWDTFPHRLLVPLNFPEAYDLKDPYVARQIPLADLKHWELAPSNPYLLKQRKAEFAVTSYGNKTGADFWKNMHKALARGWTVKDALTSLTVVPAKAIGMENELGTLEAGKVASFSVFDKNPFLYSATLLETWSNGRRMIKAESPAADIRGTYTLNIDGMKYFLDVKGTPAKPEAKIRLPRTISDSLTGAQKADTLNADATFTYSENDVLLHFILKDKKPRQYSLKGMVNTRIMILEGDGTGPEGNWVKWSAFRNKSDEKGTKDELPDFAWTLDTAALGRQLYPNMSYGLEKLPEDKEIVIENATIWTNEDAGILQRGTVIVRNGKITAVHSGSGSYGVPAGALVIDATGKHLTSGIIDEHSHIALSKGVNEGGQAISAEVRMSDVINPDDINIYRALGGGVTAAQLLHGSANPIGGQSALVKLKWGHLPSDFLIPNAPKFVKFALGENVKQTNWGDFNTVRFPQTRMGVEQVYIDGFSRALAYHDAMTKYGEMSGKQREKSGMKPPARDLELDALYEIVKGERRITCHSYIQSEINMLMHVADSFNFQVNTFTHILEGYKVADKMKKHGAGASTFADWWAYKYEVKDAVPYNASLMNEMGLVVSINSDDAEMGRRLNQEAAKVVKYGGIAEVEAWKMVTLNPAKLLHLDDRMGSVKAGKDADLVLWTTNPLSINAKVLYTIVDGEVLYDSERDYRNTTAVEAERARIITKMLDSSKKGEAVKPFVRKRRGAFHCDTLGEEYSTGENSH
jgi:imidazolonepropionase-like amidohydrolase